MSSFNSSNGCKFFKRILTLTIIVASGFSAHSQNPDFQVYNMANTPVFTSNLFRVPAVDKDGIVYMGTPRQGMYRYSHGVWTKMSILTNHQINEIRIDEFNKVWIAQSGQGGLQALTGGVNSFDDSLVNNFTYYGNTAPASLPTNNVRGIFVGNTPKVWTSHIATSLSGSVSSLGLGVNFLSPYFNKITGGINSASMDCIAGNDIEVWAAANNNKVGLVTISQILRYNASTGVPIGFYDYTNIPDNIYSPSSYARSLLFASDGRQWIGLSNGGGVIVKNGNEWKLMNNFELISLSTTVNNNSIFEDSKGRIFVGTSTGLLMYQSGDIDKIENWTKFTVADGLPNDNVTGIAEDKVNNTIIITTSGGVVFWKSKQIAELKWDNSYLYLENSKPIGVAADGVSRIYIRVFSGQGLPSISKARVKIIQKNGQPRSMQGKLQKATNGFSYSDEANNASALDVFDEVYPGKAEYFFWYVSPDDFCNDPGSTEADSVLRTEKVRVYVNYSNGTNDSADLDVKIVRPPLVLVHGLASNPEAWNKFSPFNKEPFVVNPLFKVRKAFRMNGKGAYIENAKTLLDKFNENGFSSTIEKLRFQGFASNQVDYVCHSMGGVMLRSAANFFPKEFYSNSGYIGSTYGKGYVHKMITINTPHNGSPVADFVAEFSPLMPEFMWKHLVLLYYAKPDMQQPFDFFEPVLNVDFLNPQSPFMATAAVLNLQVQKSKGGINLRETKIRNHLIVSDIDWESPGSITSITAFSQTMNLFSGLVDVSKGKFVGGLTKIGFNALYGGSRINKVWTVIDDYCTTKGYPNFLGDGDLIVPLSSETAAQPLASSHITKFGNSIISINDANHIAMVERTDVGDKVMELLNTRISSSLFSLSIPANLDPEPLGSSANDDNTNIQQHNLSNSDTTIFSKSKIEIKNPVSGPSPLFTDSSISVTIQLKDTSNLAYIKILFQDADTTTTSRIAAQSFNFKINPEYAGSQYIMAVAAYDKPDGTEYNVDTLIKVITYGAVPTAFRIRQDSLTINAGEHFFPDFDALISGKWIRLATNSPDILLTIKDIPLLSYTSNKALKGLSAGSTKVYVNYLGFKDTVGVLVLPGLFANSINQTISSGSFKDPAIWSRGVIPGSFDSVIIKPGHIVVLDTTLQIRTLLIQNGGKLQFNGNKDTLSIGLDGNLDKLGFIRNFQFEKIDVRRDRLAYLSAPFFTFNCFYFPRNRFYKIRNRLVV